jgi:hypothetical protein
VTTVPDDRLQPESAPRATRQRTIRRYGSPRGSYEAVLDHEGGTTTISADGRPVLVAAWAPGSRLSPREGLTFDLGGRAGRLHRPRYGVRARSREVQVEVEDRTWRARAHRGRIVLERDGAVVASHRFGAVALGEQADPDDTAVTVLFTALGLWSQTRFWTRLFDAF